MPVEDERAVVFVEGDDELVREHHAPDDLRGLLGVQVADGAHAVIGTEAPARVGIAVVRPLVDQHSHRSTLAFNAERLS